LRVNDEASDTSPFVIDADGKVGIGVIPTVSLHVAGQCVTGDSRLRRRRKKKKGEAADPEKDEWEDDEYIYDEVMIKDILPGDEIASMNPITGELVYSQVNGLMNMGIKEIYKLTTQSGRFIRTTGNHPYFVRGRYDDDDVLQDAKPKFQKLVRFEVDQSIRVEEYTKDTVIAIANKENNFSVVIPRKVKRTLRNDLLKFDSKEFTPAMFAFGIVSAIKHSKLIVHELAIDIEYPGHENIITGIISSVFPQIEIDFVQIGKKSPAHYSAYSVYKKQKTADYIADINDIALNAENALGAVTPPHIRRTIRRTWTSLVNSSIKDNKNVVNPYVGLSNFTKSGQWTRVKDIREGQMIAVVYGDKVVWERITKIKRQNPEKVYDIEVQGTHNFVANGIVAHNTYLNGKVGIGVETPSAVLHLKAGTATAGTAPLKFTSGTNLTTAEAGAMEYDGTNLYFSLSNGTRKTLGYTDGTNIDHGGLLGLSDDDHTQYALLAGRSAGQTLIGGTTTTSDLTLQTTSGVGTTGADMHFLVGNAGGTEAMTILNNGKVGIGTDSPLATLHLDGTTSTIRLTPAPGEYGRIQFTDSTPSNVVGEIYVNAGSEKMHLYSDRLVIQNNGNIGIGTTDPQEKLDVAGKIAVNGVARVYYPDQTDFLGTMYLGNGDSGASLSHTAGDQGQKNTFIGIGAGNANTTGYKNTASGYDSLYSNTTGYSNIANGYVSLYDITEGFQNTAIGYNTGRGITTGDNNTIIGANVTGLAADLSNNIIIADGAGNRRINVDSSGNVGIGTWDTGSAGLLAIRDNASVKVNLSATDAVPSYFTASNVGIGTTSPGTLLQLEKDGDAYLTLKNATAENTDGGAETRIIFEDHSDIALAQIQGSHDGTGDNTKGDLIFSTHSGSALAEAMRIDSSGRVGIGGDPGTAKLYVNGNVGIGTTNPGGGTGSSVLTLANSSAAPALLANTTHLYSSAGEGYWMDAAGHTTLQTPHDLETGEWIFSSSNINTEKTLEVKMEQLTKEMDRILGGGYVIENGLPYYTGEGVINGLIEDIQNLKQKVDDTNSLALDSGIEEFAREQSENGTLVFEEGVFFKGHVAFNGDTVGAGKIEAGEELTEIEFEQEYGSEPIVTATFVGENILDADFKFTIVDKSENGFIIKIKPVQEYDLEFNWHAFGMGEEDEEDKEDEAAAVVAAAADEVETIEAVDEVDEVVETVDKAETTTEETVDKAETTTEETVEDKAEETTTEEAVVEETVADLPAGTGL